jgi:hydroxymethylpyrimidine pyrophosphatase-like HAD family hydrolase
MTFINVIPAGISKGSGVQEIAQAMGISLDQVIAVGDSVGDIEALEIAGLGVAMGNAEEELKQHADYIAASVWEDGVAQILERFLL